jgi:hypothetical protein
MYTKYLIVRDTTYASVLPYPSCPKVSAPQQTCAFGSGNINVSMIERFTQSAQQQEEYNVLQSELAQHISRCYEQLLNAVNHAPASCLLYAQRKYDHIPNLYLEPLLRLLQLCSTRHRALLALNALCSTVHQHTRQRFAEAKSQLQRRTMPSYLMGFALRHTLQLQCTAVKKRVAAIYRHITPGSHCQYACENKRVAIFGACPVLASSIT